MRKYLFIFAFVALALAACNKETELDNPAPIAQTITLTASGEAFSEVDMNGVPTKGTLNAAGNFLWATGDQIGVRLYKGTNWNGTWTAYGNYEARDATFTLKDGFDGLPSGDFQSNDSSADTDQYVNWGYAAFYPRFSNNISNSDGKVYFELKKVYENYTSGTCLMPMVACLGDGSDNSRPADISLKHVGAGVRVTLKDVPANANQASLTVTGKNIVNGTANTDWYGVNPANAGTDAISATDGTGENTVYLKFATASDKRDITFIFPLPTVDLSGGITLKLYYDSGAAEPTEFWHKTAGTKTPLPALGRCDLLDLPELTVNGWKTLGTGRFIDNFLWSKITSDDSSPIVDKDVPGYVNVTIEQKADDPYTFRLVDPYGAAATQFGYTSANAENRDPYFEFTVAGFTQGSAVTNFETHKTGFAIDSGNNPELVYATNYDSVLAASNDKVVLGGETAPKIVQLAPIYRHNATAYYYTQYLNNRKGVFRIIFPGVDGYTCSLTPASGCTARLDKLSWANGSSSARVRIIASEYTDYEIASPIVNEYYIGNYPGAKDAATSSGTWNGDSLTGVTVNGSSIPSGVVYLTWYAVDSSSENYVYDQGRTKVYYINKTDYDKYVKSHTFNYGETTAAGTWKYGTIEFGLSDNPTKGQLILKDVDGMTSVAANTRLTADHPLWTAMGSWLAHGTGDYAYSADRVLNGKTIYGIFNNNRLSFATNSDNEFFNYSVDGVSGHTAKVIIFSNDGSTSDLPQELAFDITSDKLTLAHDYLVARWIGYYWNGSTVTNNGGKASKPLAQKDGDQRPYISLE